MTTASATGHSLGGTAPWFDGLLGVDGGVYSTDSFADASVLVLVFVSNGCPTVRLYEERLVELHARTSGRGTRIVLVNSNNPHLSPSDTRERTVERAKRSGLPFAYLSDPGGGLARACDAICTPHAFVFDGQRRLRYRGRIDDSRTGRAVTSHDLGNAIEDVLEGRSVRVPETAPFGCAIVW